MRRVVMTFRRGTAADSTIGGDRVVSRGARHRLAIDPTRAGEA